MKLKFVTAVLLLLANSLPGSSAASDDKDAVHHYEAITDILGFGFASPWEVVPGNLLVAAKPLHVSGSVIDVAGTIQAQRGISGDGVPILLEATERIVVSGSILGADGMSYGVVDALAAPDGGEGSSIILKAPRIEILPGAVIQPGHGGAGGSAVPSDGPDGADVIGGDGGDGGWLVLLGQVILPNLGEAWLGNAMGGDGGAALSTLTGNGSAIGGNGGHFGTLLAIDSPGRIVGDRASANLVAPGDYLHLGFKGGLDLIDFACPPTIDLASLEECLLDDDYGGGGGGVCDQGESYRDCLLGDYQPPCNGGNLVTCLGLPVTVGGILDTILQGDGACDGADGADAVKNGEKWTGGPAAAGADGVYLVVAGGPGQRGYDGTGPGHDGGHAEAGNGTDGCWAGKGGNGGDASADGGDGQAGGPGGRGGSGDVLGGAGGVGGNGGPAGNGGYAKGGHPGCGGWLGKPGSPGTASAVGGVSPGGAGGTGGAGQVPGQHGTPGAPQSGTPGTMITQPDCVNN
jgi:hypothetical protein